MQKKLPVLSALEIIKALSKAGFVQVTQRGSHVKLKRFDENKKTLAICIVPNYKEISKHVLNCILKQAKLSREEFNKLTEK